MNILVIGGNAASDYIIQQLLMDDRVNVVYHWATRQDAEATSRYIPLNDIGRTLHHLPNNLLLLVEKLEFDLVISQVVLFCLWDELRQALKIKNVPLFMVSKSVAMMEWSKIKGKALLKSLDIPSPKYVIMGQEQLLNTMISYPRPFVLKYEQDWRSGEQTIIVTDDNYQDTYNHICSDEGSSRYMKGFVGEFKDLSFVVEDFLSGGREYSYHAIFNSTGWKFIGAARDYKKRYENDIGPNTVGMGSYAPAFEVDPVVHEYADRIISYLNSNGNTSAGILYLGIMVDQQGKPHVLEINTRFGDPESQSLLQLIDNNLLDLFYNTAKGLPIEEIQFNNKAAVSVRIVNKDYHNEKPGTVNCDLWPLIPGITISQNSQQASLHSVVSTSADTIEQASNVIYKFLENKLMGDYTYRTDIGYLK